MSAGKTDVEPVPANDSQKLPTAATPPYLSHRFSHSPSRLLVSNAVCATQHVDNRPLCGSLGVNSRLLVDGDQAMLLAGKRIPGWKLFRCTFVGREEIFDDVPHILQSVEILRFSRAVLLIFYPSSVMTFLVTAEP